MNSAVVGMAFGDEGKGLVASYLCRFKDCHLVVRYSGGQQAGHTVYTNKRRHVFASFGSGSLLGVPTYISEFCTVDPIAMVNELNVLLSKGVCPVLYVNRSTPVTTPYEVSLNRLDSLNMGHGSCGMGVGKTFQREESHHHLHFEDLFLPRKILDAKLDSIFADYITALDRDEFYSAISTISKYPHISSVGGLPEGYDYLFEGSQGLLLDQEIGFFPNVTRSYTGLKGIRRVLDSRNPLNVYYVTRAYQNRHGAGFMTNHQPSSGIIDNSGDTNVSNKYQGDFKTSLLDLDLLLYGLNKNRQNDQYVSENLVITCLDQIPSYELVQNDEIFKFESEREFIDYIRKALGIEKVFLSRSPESKNITIYKD